LAAKSRWWNVAYFQQDRDIFMMCDSICGGLGFRGGFCWVWLGGVRALGARQYGVGVAAEESRRQRGGRSMVSLALGVFSGAADVGLSGGWMGGAVAPLTRCAGDGRWMFQACETPG